MGPTDPTGAYRREPEVSPASGGHLAPDTVQSPLVGDPAATQSLPVRPEADPRRNQAGGRRPVRRRPVRRVRRTLRHVDPVSVFKLSLFYYGCVLVVWLIFVAISYFVASGLGLFDLVEEVGSVFVVRWEISLFDVEKWALLLGLLGWVFASIVNLVLAFLYNVAADFVGGVEMTFVERDG